MTDIVLKNISDSRIHLDVLASLIINSTVPQSPYAENRMNDKPLKLGTLKVECWNCDKLESVTIDLGTTNGRNMTIGFLKAITLLPSPMFESFIHLLKEMRPHIFKDLEEATKDEAIHEEKREKNYEELLKQERLRKETGGRP